MKVVLSPDARRQIDSLQSLHYRGTGIVAGQVMGSWLIIEEVWPVPVAGGNAHQTRDLLRRTWGARLRGMLVANRKLRLQRDLEEEVIVEIQGGAVRYLICRWDDRSHRLVLETLEEEA